MTPDEAASILEVDTDAEAADILAAYSAKAAQSRAENGGDAVAAQGEVQLLGEARVTLMTHRQQVQGSQQRAELARTSGAPAIVAAPRNGSHADAPKLTPSGWPEDAPKGKTAVKKRSPDEEESRKKRAFLMAAIGLVLSFVAWISVLGLPITVLGMGLCVWSLVRVRGYGSGMYTGTRVVAWIGLVLGLLAVIGSALVIMKALGH
jgi:hypothetical protein